jgi:hypothetical protein
MTEDVEIVVRGHLVQVHRLVLILPHPVVLLILTVTHRVLVQTVIRHLAHPHLLRVRHHLVLAHHRHRVHRVLVPEKDVLSIEGGHRDPLVLQVLPGTMV